MSRRVDIPFDVVGWDETPYDEPAGGPRLARVTVKKVFRGVLEGQSTAELLMCQAEPKDYTAGAGFVASEKVTGTLDGKSGTFVLQHGGIMEVGFAPKSFGNVVPGTGTGELKGLRGTAEFRRSADGKHSLTLEYELDQGSSQQNLPG